MNSIKRLFVSIKGQIDHVADEFENHEALAGVAIKDLQEMTKKTKLHLFRVSKMTEHYQKQLQEQQEQAALWSERAIKSKQDDEQKALQCVKRLRQAQQQISLFEQQYRQSKAQEEKINTDLNKIQDQLHIIKNKKEILAARQNRSNAQGIFQDSSSPLQEVDNLFERWEGSVVSSESDQPNLSEFSDTDSFANTFEMDEDKLELSMMLDELIAADSQEGDNHGG